MYKTESEFDEKENITGVWVFSGFSGSKGNDYEENYDQKISVYFDYQYYTWKRYNSTATTTPLSASRPTGTEGGMVFGDSAPTARLVSSGFTAIQPGDYLFLPDEYDNKQSLTQANKVLSVGELTTDTGTAVDFDGNEVSYTISYYPATIMFRPVTGLCRTYDENELYTYAGYDNETAKYVWISEGDETVTTDLRYPGKVNDSTLVILTDSARPMDFMFVKSLSGEDGGNPYVATYENIFPVITEPQEILVYQSYASVIHLVGGEKMEMVGPGDPDKYVTSIVPGVALVKESENFYMNKPAQPMTVTVRYYYNGTINRSVFGSGFAANEFLTKTFDKQVITLDDLMSPYKSNSDSAGEGCEVEMNVYSGLNMKENSTGQYDAGETYTFSYESGSTYEDVERSMASAINSSTYKRNGSITVSNGKVIFGYHMDGKQIRIYGKRITYGEEVS